MRMGLATCIFIGVSLERFCMVTLLGEGQGVNWMLCCTERELWVKGPDSDHDTEL